jgi:hypothetical protein
MLLARVAGCVQSVVRRKPARSQIRALRFIDCSLAQERPFARLAAQSECEEDGQFGEG